MITRLKLALPQTEYKALMKLAESETRNPPDQLRHILRVELERRGLLPTEAAQPQPEVEATHA